MPNYLSDPAADTYREYVISSDIIPRIPQFEYEVDEALLKVHLGGVILQYSSMNGNSNDGNDVPLTISEVIICINSCKWTIVTGEANFGYARLPHP